jgi:hypothetical protein
MWRERRNQSSSRVAGAHETSVARAPEKREVDVGCDTRSGATHPLGTAGADGERGPTLASAGFHNRWLTVRANLRRTVRCVQAARGPRRDGFSIGDSPLKDEGA